MAKVSLYLAGGGARGAYQAGVLKAISEIAPSKKTPFTIVTGTSVGSINAAVIAQHADNFAKGVEKLVNLWSNIHCQQIFNASNYALSKSVIRNIGNIVVKQRRSGYLLDTSPLYDFLEENIDFDKIEHNIANNNLETLEVISNCYEMHSTVSFYQHTYPEFQDWRYPRHVSKRTTIDKNHIVASSALPLFFPPTKIDKFHYGDGSMGLVSPLRGALRFKVDKIMVIGTRQSPLTASKKIVANGEIGFAQVLGNMLNGLFIDNLDRDIETVNKMNDIARLLSLWKKKKSSWRPVETMYIRPQKDVARIAQGRYKSIPALLRFLLNVMGAQSHSGDLLSFLLFEKEFTCQLLEEGYNDTMAQAEQVANFLEKKT